MFAFLKKCWYLIVVLCLFFVFSSCVEGEAITFYYTGKIYYNNKFERVSAGETTFIKHRSGTNSYAYCGSQKKQFNGNSGSANYSFIYVKDSSWSSAVNCRYYGLDDELKNDGKCSAILGYIIKNSNGTSEDAYMRTQGAVWTYLSKFTYSPYSDGNTGGGWNNPAIHNILIESGKEYARNKEAADGMPKKKTKLLSLSIAEDVNTRDLNDSDKIGLYYVPSNETCGKGKYMSGKITVTNNSKKKVRVNFSSNKNVTILINGSKLDEADSNSIVLNQKGNAGSSATVQLQSKYYKEGVGVEFYVSASAGGKNVSVPDTVRYKDGGDSVNHQAMFILKSSSKKSLYTFDKTFKLDYKQVVHKHCNGVDSNNPEYPKYYTSGTQDKKCANNVSNKSDTIAHFSACTCVMVPIDGDKKVGVTLKENVKFYFGNFAPGFVYPGGGFSFYTQESGTNGVASAYYSGISWDFVDWHGDNPYYNKNNGIGNANELVDKVNEHLNNMLSGKKLTLNIDTEDSNTSTFDKKKNFNYKLDLDIDDIPEEFGVKYLEFGINPITMNPSYLSNSGVVSYTADSLKYPVDGGNKYYVPLNYTNGSLNEEEKFNFNITNTNLSLSGYFSFNYSGQCYEPVKTYDLKSNLNYRPISEDNPFPNNVIAANWKEWYDSDTNNLLRLKNSFSSDKLLYSVNLNANNISSVLGKYNKVYTNWDYVGSNGKDQLVNDNNLFTQRAKSDSYCAIGTFDSKCDK